MTDFLLDQQCAAGFFRLRSRPGRGGPGAARTARRAAPDTDATALALLALPRQADDTDVAPPRRRPRVAAQHPAAPTAPSAAAPRPRPPTPTAPAWPAGRWARTASTAPRRAAGWVLGIQVTDPAARHRAGRRPGAIAYDAAAPDRRPGRRHHATTQDQWRRATFQAAPALLTVLSAAPGAKLTGPSGFVQAGPTPKLTLSGLATGETICFSGPRVPGARGHRQRHHGHLPGAPGSATAKRTYLLQRQASSTTTSFQVLGPQRLQIT